jgi:methionyl-tRNA formyltransferase
MTRNVLAEMRPDLGISIGNRVIGEQVFSLPRLGMINLHHGRIPEYRGGPPAFWELFDGARSLGISVHQIDSQIDHGAVLVRGEVPIHAGDDPKRLMERAYGLDYILVGRAVEEVARGGVPPDPGGNGPHAIRTLPSRAEVKQLRRKVGRPIRHDDYRRAALPDLPKTTAP